MPDCDNEDEQVNDTHINNYFNHTIPQFVLCKRASTDAFWTTFLHPQRVSRFIDYFDILFQTRVKMCLVPSLNWPLLHSSTMTICRLCAPFFPMSMSGMGTGGGDIEPGVVGIVVVACLI